MSDVDRASMRDLAAAYAIGALDADEERAFESLLAESEELRREVTEYREVSALLAHDAAAVTLDPSLRKRLLDSVKGRSARPRNNWRHGLAWAAAAAGIILAGVQSVRVGNLSQELTTREQAIQDLTTALAARDATLNDILEPSTVFFVLTSTTEQPPSIRLFWNRAANNVVLHASSLDPAPTGREYQLWFLAGGAPIPASTFNSDPSGVSLVTLPGPPEDVEIQGAAITLEPAGGSAQPTTPILLVGDAAM